MSRLEELKRAVETLTFEERVELDVYLWSTMPNVRYSTASVSERMQELEQAGPGRFETSVVREESK